MLLAPEAIALTGAAALAGAGAGSARAAAQSAPAAHESRRSRDRPLAGVRAVVRSAAVGPSVVLAGTVTVEIGS
jgi:hypothetical protein